MLKRIYLIIICLFVALGYAEAKTDASLLDEGVSWSLAQHRKQIISNLRYDISFDIPEDKSADIEASETVSFVMRKKADIILDFREARDKIHEVKINGKACEWRFVNEHIVISSSSVRKGENKVFISFTAGNQSLNRRDGYVYTLFVPDRARTVFPCFDQPNLKGKFKLHLDIPKNWKAVTNDCPDTPIPTYLFAFAAGDFKHETYTEDGITIGAFHRETDSTRIAQLPEIMHQVVFALKWQEEFTGVKYPFPKYDLVILPGFQFGGMEHVGATFYNDNTLFLSANPTPDEMLNRTQLIAHETSHMWFGDAVTMDWFNDVWTKEVFANYFAAEITAPLFPDINHELNWLKTYVTPAIAQDRTEGRTSIRQDLDNMRFSGLIYNNIIYNKAPVMMRKMVGMMGKDAFRRGIQKYVSKYLYSNATWDDLIDILDNETPADLKAFSKHWVDTPNWPVRKASSAYDAIDADYYGYTECTQKQLDSLVMGKIEMDDTQLQRYIMTSYENYLNKKLHPELMMRIGELAMLKANPLVASTIVSCYKEPLRELSATTIERNLWNSMVNSIPYESAKTQMLRLLISTAESEEITDSLYTLWKRNDSQLLSINDYMTLSYELAIRMPEKADSIIAAQRTRISNPDRLAQFDFISRAVIPSEEKRDALFESLKKAENRRIEPWTLSVLYYLNHPMRQHESLKYIEPALELLPEIQRTGDIFFPGNWCSNLLAGHRSKEAYDIVEKFLANHKDYPQLLINKILYAEYQLKRSQKDKQ